MLGTLTKVVVVLVAACAVCSVARAAPASMLSLCPVGSHGSTRLRPSDLALPDSMYWPACFWVWTGTLTNQPMAAQIREMALQGIMGAVPIGYPADWRTDSMPSFLSPDYLTPGYIELHRYVAEQAQANCMRVWLYEEGGWPDGSCDGRVVKQNPDLAVQALTRQELKPAAGETVNIPSDCVSAFLFQGATRIKRLDPGASQQITINNARVLIYRCVVSGTYPDLLNPRSAQEFIRLTHEKYKPSNTPYFGNTITCVFGDEASVYERPWTDGAAEDFQAYKGYDVTNEFPSIDEGEAQHDKQVRVDWHDWWSKRFAESYFESVQNWCHQNNLCFTGHLNNEDTTIDVCRTNGSPFRSLRKYDIPGVDVIWRQIFPGKQNHFFPKYASSVAHTEGRRWAATESFAVYGSGLTFQQMKWITDYQFVRGVNLELISGRYISMKDFWMGGVGGDRPFFDAKSPLWKYMKHYAVYVARLSYLLSQGSPGITTAVYYPTRDIWAGGPEVTAIGSSIDAIVALLLKGQRDFDFIDDDILERASTTVTGGKLRVATMRYDTVVVPRCSWLSAASSARLAQFAASGGKVLWVDGVSGDTPPAGSTNVTSAQLAAQVKPLIEVTPPNDQVRVCKRTMDNGSLYFLTYEGACQATVTVSFDEHAAKMVEIDPQTGRLFRPPIASRTAAGWSATLSFSVGGSRVIFFTDDQMPESSAPGEMHEVLLSLEAGWSVRKLRSYALGEHEIEVMGITEDPAPVSLGDWRGVLGNGFSGDAVYDTSFVSGRDTAQTATVLDLGDVRYACEVWLNGQSLGKALWSPYVFPVKGKLREGTNSLRVMVTNTLANQYTTASLLDRWPANPVGPYHSTSLSFEPESVTSGLYGPVRIGR